MMQNHSEPIWWAIVKKLAELMVDEEGTLGEQELRDQLRCLGYMDGDIARAYEWLDLVNLSGTLAESLAMLTPSSSNARVANPIEAAYLSTELWGQIQLCRFRGLLSDDMVERLLEGVRSVDTRDWEDEDVCDLLTEILGVALPGRSYQKCLAILEGRSLEYLS